MFDMGAFLAGLVDSKHTTPIPCPKPQKLPRKGSCWTQKAGSAAGSGSSKPSSSRRISLRMLTLLATRTVNC